MVVKKADGSIRFYADFSTGLNAPLEHPQHSRMIPEDIFTIIKGGICFAKQDLTKAYLRVEVSAASKELQTINTLRFISIHIVTLWSKNSLRYIPADHGHC